MQKEIVQKKEQLTGIMVGTIYLGGGTPSLLTGQELTELLDLLHKHYLVSKDAEITLEANPDDLSVSSLISWRKAGINRLSIGVQSFHEPDLIWMNRAHTAAESLQGIALVREAGFDNFSIDLIYGTPGLSDQDWLANVDRAITMQIPHLSCYALTVEEKTALAHLIKTKKMQDTDPEQQSRQFILLMDRLRAAGYEHYEISNFALPGWRSRHNSAYWKGELYLGFGPGAHSYDGRFRSWNKPNNTLYVRAIEEGTSFSEQEELTPENRRHEYIMTSLRTMEGVDLVHFHKEFGPPAAHQLELQVAEYLKLTESEGPIRLRKTPGNIRLTDEGKLFADGIAGFLF